MSKPNIMNTTDSQSAGASAQLFYIEIEGNPLEKPIETQAIPLNMLVNSLNQHFLVPVKDKTEQDQVCVYVESATLDESSLLSYISGQKLYPVNGNTYSVSNSKSLEPSISSLASIHLEPSTSAGHSNITMESCTKTPFNSVTTSDVIINTPSGISTTNLFIKPSNGTPNNMALQTAASIPPNHLTISKYSSDPINRTLQTSTNIPASNIAMGYSAKTHSISQAKNMTIEPSNHFINGCTNVLTNYNKEHVVSGNFSIQNCDSNINTIKEITTTEEKKRIRGFAPVPDRVVPPRAVAVLPSSLHIRRNCIYPRRSLPDRLQFGPVQGVFRTISRSAAHNLVLNSAESKKPLFLTHNKDSVVHIDVTDKDKSNWLGLLPLGNQNTANVWLYEEENNLYGITVQTIPARTPLALGYTKPYLQEHGFPEGLPELDISEELTKEPRQWWCFECHRVFRTSTSLRHHNIQCHKDGAGGSANRKKYACRYCKHPFRRVFTLKRHMAHFCEKKPEKEILNKSITAEDLLNTSFNIEDNRLPSDESLQNYSNGLDFSTSLFDTDRIPGLDISGNSRSETEFNPYGLPYRDDNASTPDLDFDKLSNVLESTAVKSQNGTKEAREQAQKPNESLLLSCPQCKQTILSENKRKHNRECIERRRECECGRSFTSTEKLAQHIYSDHFNSMEQKKEPTNSTTTTNNLEYKCERCPLSFKRRGMLVNHLWRVHACSLAVPMERRVRHYPCAACPKLYRTAAKRDAHQAAHHPGACGGRYAIEGARRSVAAAACAACPRQYATRAKLLQHVRQRHPELAPMAKPSMKTKKSSSIPAT